ncbi:Uncharacterised protein [Candidatus Norongarragalina meridionalis]|nr:Uncharacterised protein [Candidatus Norongarragalina meridionalis]
MNSKFWLAGLAVVLLVSTGLALAAPNLTRWPDENNATWHHPDFNGTPPDFGNSTGHQPRMMRGDWNGTRPNLNATKRSTFNETAFAEFNQAVLNDDYATAKQLNAEYGFGGRLFDILNQSTFDKFAHIEQLRAELTKDLGLNDTQPGDMPGFEMPGFGFERGIPPHLSNAKSGKK